MGFHHFGQAGLKLLTSSDPPTSAPQISGITASQNAGITALQIAEPPYSASAYFKISSFLSPSLLPYHGVIYLCQFKTTDAAGHSDSRL